MTTFVDFWQRAGALTDVPRIQLARLRSSPFVRSASILSGGSAIGHACTLAVSPILTRIYGASDFGILGLFTSFLSVMLAAVSLQYEVSIVSGRDEAEAAYLTLASFLFALPVSIMAGGILWGLIHFAALGFGALPCYTPVLLALVMCFAGAFTALRYWSLREDKLGRISQGVVVQSAGRAMFQAVLGAVGFHQAGLLLGEAIGRCMGMSRMFRSAWPVLRVRIAAFRWEEFTLTLWRNRKFPMYSLPSSFLDALCLGLTVPLLIRLYGVSVGGHYSLVWKAITVPSVLITVAVADTFHTRLASCARETPNQVMRLFLRTSAGLLIAGSIPAAILWLWGEPLFQFVFGAQWGLAGAIAATVAPWYLAQFIVSPVSRVVAVLSGQETKLIWDVLSLGMLFAVFFVAQRRGMMPLQTVKILTIVNTCLHAFYYLLLIRIITQFEKIQDAQSQVSELL